MSNNQQPTTLYHCSICPPSLLNEDKLKPHLNTTIAGETVNAIFADIVPADKNPYTARVQSAGMYCVGNMVIYNNDNISHIDNKLILKQPVYQYELDGSGFEKIESNGTTEYILRDKSIDATNTKVTEITDVTALCQDYQLFSDVSGKNVGERCMQIAQDKGFDAAMNAFKAYIASGDIVYHNEYTGVNVDKQFSSTVLPHNKTKSSRFDAAVNKFQFTDNTVSEYSKSL